MILGHNMHMQMASSISICPIIDLESVEYTIKGLVEGSDEGDIVFSSEPTMYGPSVDGLMEQDDDDYYDDEEE